jgi:hypothetical protein
MWTSGAGASRAKVIANPPSRTSMAADASAYRTRDERTMGDIKASASATSAPSHNECSSVRPSAAASGLSSSVSSLIIWLSPRVV